MMRTSRGNEIIGEQCFAAAGNRTGSIGAKTVYGVERFVSLSPAAQ